MSSFAFTQGNCPCCTDAHRAFDFWVGQWEAVDSSGNLLGTNNIEIIQGGCALRESWSSATSGYTGTSYNYYNITDSTWNQVWIDNQGSQLVLKGNATTNRIVMSSDSLSTADGDILVHRITWLALSDGTVRQHWQTFKGRAGWSTAFDGIYKRKSQ